MPATSIDMFFACTLVVSVAIIATAFLAGAMQTQISSMQDLNKQDYLRTIADHIATSYGSPENWGSSGLVPTSLGLSAANGQGGTEIDTDKVTRLNNQNSYALSYLDAFNAARLKNIAFGVSVSQILQMEIVSSAISPNSETTAYTFQIKVSEDLGPVRASLRCHVLASEFISDVSNETSNLGIGYITVELPNSANGPALLVVFARATFDDRLTAYNVLPFAHLSEEPQPNRTFVDLSPLNYKLTVNSNYSTVTVKNMYAFSYSYQSNLTSSLGNTYLIPTFTDKSPIILVAQGTNGEVQFNEWTAYPQVPLEFGANLSHSETNVYDYPVVIKGALYKLTLHFGDVMK
jgi:hypothetical protein